MNRRDWEWIAAMLSPEIEWLHVGRDERVRGVQPVLASFRGLFDENPSATVEVHAIHDAGLVVIAECGIRQATAPKTKGAVQIPSFCEVMCLSQGRCARGSTYSDSVRMLMAINHSQVAA